MSKRPHPIGYGVVERDLVRLTDERVGHAIRSVLQVAQTDAQVTCIAFGGITAALAAAVGALRAAGKIDPSLEETAAARVILDMIDEAQRGAANG